MSQNRILASKVWKNAPFRLHLTKIGAVLTLLVFLFTIFGSDETGRNSCHLPELVKLHKFSKCCSFVIFHFTIKNYTQFIPTYCVVSKFRKSGTYPMYVSDSRG